jgi:hypothetical protein
VPGTFTLNNQVMLVTGKTRLYVKGDFNMLGNSVVKIVSGAGLQLYVAGANAMLTQVIALDPYATAPVFQYYGLPGNTNLWWTGNVAFVGTIYAPSAALTLGGGGSYIRDFQGACAAGSILLNSHIYIHFDEDLQKGGPQR